MATDVTVARPPREQPQVCIAIPDPARVHAISVKYGGRGTQTNDVVLVGVIVTAAVLIVLVISWFSRS